MSTAVAPPTAPVQEIEVESEGRRLGAWYLRAEDESLAGDAGRPCVVMAHGFGAAHRRKQARGEHRFVAG